MPTNPSKNKIARALDWLAAGVLVLFALGSFFFYGRGAAALSLPQETNAVRIEIQRYLGYEALPVRYLSLPYDLVMNSNVYLAILDMGVLLLIFLPIAVLLGFLAKPGAAGAADGPARRWKAPVLAVAVVVACLFLVIISTANGYIAGRGMKIVKSPDIGNYLSETSFAEAPVGVACARFYQQCIGLYQAAVEPALQRVSGSADAVTYPLLLAFFALFVYIGAVRFRDLPMAVQGLLYFTLAYLFFWLMLSAGIVWYGLLAFPLLTAFVFGSMLGKDDSAGLAGKVGKYAFLGVVAAYLVMGFAHRISNLTLAIMATDPIAGKRMYDPAYLQYLTGDFTEENVYDAYYPGLGRALRSINAEDKSLIYNVGTRFNFFIRANDKRIFKDDQLDFFNQIISKYKNKAQVTAMLKAAGFRYLMVDFNTPSSDRTPEQQLLDRFKKFMLLFYQNPDLEMLATNRVIKETSGGKEQYIYGVFGEVKEPGSFAIFRIK